MRLKIALVFGSHIVVCMQYVFEAVSEILTTFTEIKYHMQYVIKAVSEILTTFTEIKYHSQMFTRMPKSMVNNSLAKEN